MNRWLQAALVDTTVEDDVAAAGVLHVISARAIVDSVVVAKAPHAAASTQAAAAAVVLEVRAASVAVVAEVSAAVSGKVVRGRASAGIFTTATQSTTLVSSRFK